MEEMEYVRKHQVYTRVPRAQCYAETGRPPIKTGWADTNKGTHEAPNVRCRWVTKEYNAGKRPDLFAGTPPLEGVKLVISEAATSDHMDHVLATIDVRRAYFYAQSKRRVFVELPAEDHQEGDEDMEQEGDARVEGATGFGDDLPERLWEGMDREQDTEQHDAHAQQPGDELHP